MSLLQPAQRRIGGDQLVSIRSDLAEKDTR